MAKQDLVVELFYSGTWNTVPASIHNPVSFNRVRPAGSEPTPFKANVTLQGIHNPKSPFSPLYGVAGQNTPIRFTLDSDVRFYGEVASWSPQRSINYDAAASKGEAWTEIEVSGILRRLGQGADAIRSALHRTMVGVTPGDFVPHAYWSMEDGEDATQFASSTPGVGPMVLSGDITLAVSDEVVGSAPLPVWLAGSNATGVIPTYTDTGTWTAQATVIPPTDLVAQNQAVTVFNVQMTGGTYKEVAVGITPGSTIGLFTRDTADNIVDTWFDTFPAGTVYGQPVTMALTATDDASGTDDGWSARLIAADGTILASIDELSGAGDYGRATSIIANGRLALATGAVIGHLGVWIDPAFTAGTDDVSNALAIGGWAGEQAHERLERLCREEGIPLTVEGTVSQAMGAQPLETLTALFAECERTDDGLLFEPRNAYGLIYRCGRERYSRPVALELDYAARDVAPPLLPILNDLTSRNDVTVRRRNGASARAVLETGPLSVQDPPDGIGRYKTQVDVNTETDDVLTDHAYWHLRKGTIDGIRYARVSVDLDAKPGLVADATAVDIGDVITIANLPDDEHPGLARLHVLGYTESVGSHRRIITYTCVPAATYDVGVWGADAATSGSRWGVWTTFLAEDLTTSETAADVTTGTDVWATTASHPGLFPAGGGAGISVVIGGLTYLCTAITGTHPNLTLTLVRLADDKTHSTGDQVWIADTFNWGI